MGHRLVLVQLTNMCNGFHGGVSVSVSNLQLLGSETARQKASHQTEHFFHATSE